MRVRLCKAEGVGFRNCCIGPIPVHGVKVIRLVDIDHLAHLRHGIVKSPQRAAADIADHDHAPLRVQGHLRQGVIRNERFLEEVVR